MPAERLAATTRVLDDAGAVGEASAALLLDAVASAAASGRAPVIGMPVGRTPLPLVAALARSDRDLSALRIVLMDDFVEQDGSGGLRRVRDAHPTSCRGAAMRDLVEPLRNGLGPARAPAPERLHSPDPTDPDATERLIEDGGGIDVFVVALGGSDGHVALNPPGTEESSRTRVVELAATTRSDNVGTFGLATEDEVPLLGVSIGLATIAGARRLLVLAHGEGKREVVARLLGGSGFDPDLPASIVRSHPDVTVLLDRAAAGRAEAGAP